MGDNISINIQKKPKVENVEKITITSPSIVYNLKEVQAIKEAVQEHLIFIGLNKTRALRNITFLGIGNSSGIKIDHKDIVRTALINACDKVILVHNHPSNHLKPSQDDKNITNYTYQFLKVFHIELVDHVIVTEENYLSMLEQGYIDKEYKDKLLDIVDHTLLIDENNQLKEKIRTLERRKSVNKDMER